MPINVQKLASHAAICLLYAMGFLLAWQNFPDLAAENHLMENLQAGAIFGAMLLAVIALWRDRYHPAAYVSHGLAVLLLTLLLRELAVERMNLPDWLILLGSGTGKNLLLGALWVTVLLALARNRSRLGDDTRRFLRSRAGVCLLATFICYLIGEVFDKRLIPLGRAELVFWEELAECFGAYWCLWGMNTWATAVSGTNRNHGRDCMLEQTVSS